VNTPGGSLSSATAGRSASCNVASGSVCCSSPGHSGI
jgi:hypothetical protein